MIDQALKNFREKYPQYNDLSDDQILKGIHKKYYSDIPYNKFLGAFTLRFAGKIKYKAPGPQEPAEAKLITLAGGVRELPQLRKEKITPSAVPPPAPTAEPQQGEVTPPPLPAGLKYAPGVKEKPLPKLEPRPRGFLENLKESFKRSMEDVNIDHLAYQAAVGLSGDREWQVAEKKFIEMYKDDPIKARNWLEKFVYGAAGIAGPMAKGTLEGLIYGGALAGAAAAAGQAGPQILAPEEVFTVPAAASIGTIIGSAQYWYRQGVGDLYRDLRREGIPREIASIVSQAGGLPYAAIEFSQAAKIFPGLKQTANRIIADTAKEYVQQMVKRYGRDWIQEVGEEGLQELSQMIFQDVGRKISNLIAGTDVQNFGLRDYFINVMRTLLESAGPMAILLGGRAVGQINVDAINAIQQQRMERAEEEQYRQILDEIAKREALNVQRPGGPVRLGETLEEFKQRQLHERINVRGEEERKRREKIDREKLERIKQRAKKKKEPIKQRIEKPAEIKIGNIVDTEKYGPVEITDITGSLVTVKNDKGNIFQIGKKALAEEIENAQRLRKDEGQIRERRIAPEGRETEGRKDLEQPAPGQPGISGIRPEEGRKGEEAVPEKEEKIPVEYVGLQFVPGAKKAVVLVNDPQGSTIGYRPEIHELDKESRKRFEEEAKDVEIIPYERFMDEIKTYRKKQEEKEAEEKTLYAHLSDEQVEQIARRELKKKGKDLTESNLFDEIQLIQHKKTIEKQILKGHPVPPDILSNYPDLFKKYEDINNKLLEKSEGRTPEKPDNLISGLVERAELLLKQEQPNNADVILQELKNYMKRVEPSLAEMRQKMPDDAMTKKLEENYNLIKNLYERIKNKLKERKELKPTEKIQISDIPLSQIKTDVDAFQNRKREYSEESVNRIVEAAKKGEFRFEEFDPILLWEDPETNELYILAGHSRTEAFKRLAKEGLTDFEKIPAKIIRGVSKQEAQEIAKRSNVLATKETAVERAQYYRELRRQGKSRKEIIEEAQKYEGRNANRILAYSFLNPDGKVIEALERTGEDPDVVKYAQWVGEARRQFTELEDSHETEMWDYLMEFGKRFGTSSEFREFINRAIQKRGGGLFGGIKGQPLNLKNLVPRSADEIEYDEKIAHLEGELKDAKKELDEKRKYFLKQGAEGEQLINALKPYEEKVSAIQKELIELKQNRDEALKKIRQSQLDLFSQIENLENEIREEGVKDETIQEIKQGRRDAINRGIEEATETAPTVPEKAEKEEKQPPTDQQKLAQKLEKILPGIEKKIDELENPAIAQQRVTPRRARIAAGMAREAEFLKKVRDIIKGMITDAEKGQLNSALFKLDTQQIIKDVLRLENFPEVVLYPFRLNDLLKDSENVKGISKDKAIIKKIEKRLSGEGAKAILSDVEIDAVESILKAIKKQKGEINPTLKILDDTIKQIRRFERAGIETTGDLKKVKKLLNEYIRPKTEAEIKEEKIKERERELIGTKIESYFPTPKPIAERMVEIADIKKGDKVLEPSAGKGNIALVIREKTGVEPDVIEISSTLRELLELRGFKIVGQDFLQFEGEYDKILMNPPFENGQDIDHVQHAYRLLKPGGKLVAIMSEGPFNRTDKKSVEFREWLARIGGESEKLPEGAFLSSERPTGVKVRLVTINKPAEENSFDKVIGKVPIEEEERFYGTKVLVKPEKEWEKEVTGTIVRVLNNGEIVEIHPDFVEDDLATFRVDANRVLIKQLIDHKEARDEGKSQETSKSIAKESGRGRKYRLLPRSPRKYEEVVEARSEFTRSPSEDHLHPSISGILKPHQRDGVNLAIESIDKNGGFLLADGTGAGKTMQELAIAAYYADRENKPALIITENDRIIKDAFEKDAAVLGVEIERFKGNIEDNKIYVATYHDLTRKKIPLSIGSRLSVLIFDESHNLKNFDKSAKAKNGIRLAEYSARVLYASATPLDKPQQIYYLNKLGIFKDYNEFLAILNELGVIEVRRKINTKYGRKEIIYYSRKPDVTAAEMAANLSRYFDQLTSEGKMVKREVSLDKLDVEVVTVQLPDQAYIDLEAIDKYYTNMMTGDPKMDGLLKARNLMAQRRALEYYKVNSTLEIIEREIKEGRQVVVFATRVNATEVVHRTPIYDQSGNLVDYHVEVISATEGTIKELEQALTEKYGENSFSRVYGSNKDAKKEIQRFQKGETKVLVATPQSGGTGINLDDVIGDKPRSMIVITPPFSAMDNVQMAGRIVRVTTKSRAKVYFIFSDTEVDEWNKAIISYKMKALGATVKGDVKKLDIEEGIVESSEALVNEILEEKGKSIRRRRQGEGFAVAAGTVRPIQAPADLIVDVGEQEAMSTKDLIRKLRKLFPEVQFRKKNLDRWLKEIKAKYYVYGLVKSRSEADIDAIAHELGHYLQNRMFGKVDIDQDFGKEVFNAELRNLDYDQDLRRTAEGFSEFIRLWLTGEDTKRYAPNFTEYFESEILEKHDKNKSFRKARKLIKKFREQGIENFVKAQAGLTEPRNRLKRIKEVLKDIGDSPFEHTLNSIALLYQRLRQKFVDDAAVVEWLFKKMLGANYYGLRAKENPIHIYRNFKMKAGAIADEMINNGVYDIHTGETITRGIRQILKDVVDRGHRLDDFLMYIYARHALTWWNPVEEGVEPKNPGISEEQARYIVDKYKNKDFDDLGDEVTKYFDELLRMVMREGGISEELYQKMRDRYPYYIPLLRNLLSDKDLVYAITRRGLANQPSPIKRAKGSDLPLEPMINAWIKHTERMVIWAQKARLMNAMVNLTNFEGLSALIKKTSPPVEAKTISVNNLVDMLTDLGVVEPNEDIGDIDIKLNLFFTQVYFNKQGIPVVSVWENGRRKWYELHPELYKFIMQIDAKPVTGLAKFLAPFARAVRLGATGINPSFIFIRNALRDSFEGLVMSQSGKTIPLHNTVSGLISELMRGKEVSDVLKQLGIDPKMAELYAKSGGVMSTMAGYDRAKLEAMADLLIERVDGNVIKFGMKHPVEGLRLLFSAIENATRIDEFKKVYYKVLKETGDKEEAFARAARASQDVTVDFARAGTVGRELNQIIPFYNAGIQGFSKFIRAFFTEKEITGYDPYTQRPVYTRINAAKRFAKGIVWLVGLSMLSYFLRNRDEWEKLEPHFRYNYFHFWINGTHLIIPTPFVIGALFHGATQTLLLELENDPEVTEEYLKYLFYEQFVSLFPLPMNIAGIGPYMQVMANKDWAGRPIEPKYARETKPPSEITYPWTTKTAEMAVKKILKPLGIDGISPIQLEYLLNAYTGGLFGRIIRPVEAVTGIKEKEKREELADLPIIGTLFARDMPLRNKYTQRFYREYREMLIRRNTENPHPLEPFIKYTIKRIRSIQRNKKLTKKEKDKQIADIITQNWKLVEKWKTEDKERLKVLRIKIKARKFKPEEYFEYIYLQNKFKVKERELIAK
ncbi:MAG: DEAD/DEAH box helicase family protein [Calditrichaeota bacterium]|nr:DEAD/DEAH box helicase family protein [Calditrichota bacterium]